MRASLLMLVTVLTSASGLASAAAPALLPLPASIVPADGSFALGGATVGVAAGDAGTAAAAARLTDLASRGGVALARATAGAGTIRFVRDRTVAGDEAYRLVVAPDRITVSASGDAGLFYGAETLWQLVTAAGPGGRINAVRIDDRPAYAWRGLMLDSARHFQPPAYVKQLLDRMAAAKLNVFHWHLTDDQGWRLQIDRYPRLTEVGAWRTPAGMAGRDAAGNPVRYGGFYSKAEVREIVAYAAARHITVVPEIEMPGHATAAIAAYPALGSTATPPAAPSAEWGVLPNLFNADDATFTFIENVLDEVMALFPSRYIHVGGDEAVKGQWRTSPAIQAKIKALGLKDENALQGWFTARIGRYLDGRGRRLLGWDEILEGGVPADATVMSWRGSDGAIAAARAGHDTILSPAPLLYVNYRQSDAADEPPGPGEMVDWQRLYGFTAPTGLTAAEQRHVLGVQANLWTEHLRRLDDTDRMIWPRAAIAAELGWSPAAGRDWASFSRRLVPELARWKALGWRHDETPLTPQIRPGAGAVTVNQPAGIGELRYTTDGSDPVATSPVIAGPIAVARPVRLAVQAMLDGQPLGPVARWTLDAASLRGRGATDLQFCANGGAGKYALRLGDGDADSRPVHWVDIVQPCWSWPAAPLDGIAGVTAQIGEVPYNFAFGDEGSAASFAKPATPGGELVIRQDGCTGPVIATLPIARGAHAATLVGRFARPVAGTHDLCVTFTQVAADPLRVLDRLTLVPAAR